MVKTGKVTGRRDLHYKSFDELLADAEACASSDVQMLGNWSLGQICEHMARTMNSSIDGFTSVLPAPVRWLLTLFIKKRFLTKGLPSGFKSPAEYVADATSADDGLAVLRAAIDRLKSESQRAPHPGFGKMTNEEWTEFHLRHAELHMSFLKPSE